MIKIFLLLWILALNHCAALSVTPYLIAIRNGYGIQNDYWVKFRQGYPTFTRTKVYTYFFFSTFPDYEEDEIDICGKDANLIASKSSKWVNFSCAPTLFLVCVDYITYYCGDAHED
jgi:hypothetical protein